MIEGLFSAAVSPSLWTQPRLIRLQEEMFKTERMLELLLEATGELSQRVDQAPEGVMRSLKDWLAALEDWLWEISSGEDCRRLAEAGEVLQQQVKTSLAGRQSSEWMRQTLRIGVAARALFQSVAGIQALEIAWNEGDLRAASTSPAVTAPGKASNRSEKKGSLKLCPTTILGLQAARAGWQAREPAWQF